MDATLNGPADPGDPGAACLGAAAALGMMLGLFLMLLAIAAAVLWWLLRAADAAVRWLTGTGRAAAPAGPMRPAFDLDPAPRAGSAVAAAPKGARV